MHGVGLSWRTDSGVTLGDSLNTFLSKHRGAKSDMGRNINETVGKLSGLRANFSDKRLQSFDVFPIPPQENGY